MLNMKKSFYFCVLVCLMLVETYVLYFPDTESLGDFIIENDPGDVTVNTQACSLIGALSEHLVQLARIQYKACIESSFSVSL